MRPEHMGRGTYLVGGGGPEWIVVRKVVGLHNGGHHFLAREALVGQVAGRDSEARLGDREHAARAARAGRPAMSGQRRRRSGCLGGTP